MASEPGPYSDEHSPESEAEDAGDALLISDHMLDAGATSAGPATPASDQFFSAADVDPRTDFERGMSYFPRVALVLIAANVAVFIWQLSRGALESKEAIIAAGALYRPAVLSDGEAWRLLTATFLHGGIDHLIGNCLVLWIVGMACEHGLGAVRTAIVYFASGLGGSLLSLAFGAGPSVGASGAVFGLAAAVVMFLFKYHRLFYVRDKQIGYVLGAWAAYQLVTGLLFPYIDNGAHLGGALCGAALVLMMKPRLARVALATGRGP